MQKYLIIGLLALGMSGVSQVAFASDVAELEKKNEDLKKEADRLEKLVDDTLEKLKLRSTKLQRFTSLEQLTKIQKKENDDALAETVKDIEQIEQDLKLFATAKENIAINDIKIAGMKCNVKEKQGNVEESVPKDKQ